MPFHYYQHIRDYYNFSSNSWCTGSSQLSTSCILLCCHGYSTDLLLVSSLPFVLELITITGTLGMSLRKDLVGLDILNYIFFCFITTHWIIHLKTQILRSKQIYELHYCIYELSVDSWSYRVIFRESLYVLLLQNLVTKLKGQYRRYRMSLYAVVLQFSNL